MICSYTYPPRQYYTTQTPVRCYKCINNPSSSEQSIRIQYDTQKRIQNTVRVSASLYTHDLASVSTTPSTIRTWNNMSDRVVPHIQKRSNSTILSTYYPGSLSPGGIGCDVKHGSYARYLNRLKGKSALRKGSIPSTFGVPIDRQNCAMPIYGNKLVKTSIINCHACNGPINPVEQVQGSSIYYQPYVFSIGQDVAVQNPLTNRMVKGTITNHNIESNTYSVFIDPDTIEVNAIDLYLVNVEYGLTNCYRL
jgi:hypothetical protein